MIISHMVCSATGLAGGMFISNSIDLQDTDVIENTAGTFGGGIYMLVPLNATLIKNVRLINNSAVMGGGGFYSDAQHNRLLQLENVRRLLVQS